MYDIIYDIICDVCYVVYDVIHDVICELTVNGPDADSTLHESAVNVRYERKRNGIRPHRKLCQLK